MKVTKLTTATAAAIASKVKADIAKMKSDVKVVDLLLADGVTPTMLVAPEKGKDTAFYDSVKAAVVAGFAVTVQGLLQKDTKALNEKAKGDKRYWQQQIGSKIKDMKNALEKRIAKANAATEGTAQTPTRKEDGWKKTLVTMIDQVTKAEGASIKDIPAFLKELKSAAARIK